jgi:DNA polymerase elongation subunit (family B)
LKTLSIDIETSPNLAYVWNLWKENVPLARLLESTEMICFGAKWLDAKPVYFYSNHEHGHQAMVEAAHQLLNEADVVMHYNGKSFDTPHLNREFLQAGLNPPAPYKQIDLYQTVRRQFKFPSGKLEYVSDILKIGKKRTSDATFDLWAKCIADDPKAWTIMKRYTIQDVRLVEDLYYKLRPWIKGHPSVALYDGIEGDACPDCGSKDLRREGYSFTQIGRFQRYQCRDCGRWSRSGKSVARVDLRPVTNG